MLPRRNAINDRRCSPFSEAVADVSRSIDEKKNVTTKRNFIEDVVKQKNGRRKGAVAVCEPARFIDNWRQRNLAVGSLALCLKWIPFIGNNFNAGDVRNFYDFGEFQWNVL